MAKTTRLETSETSGAPESFYGELEALRHEVAELREALANAGVAVKPATPQEPSFGISEGTRDELEREGHAVSPFTGNVLTKEDL